MLSIKTVPYNGISITKDLQKFDTLFPLFEVKFSLFVNIFHCYISFSVCFLCWLEDFFCRYMRNEYVISYAVQYCCERFCYSAGTYFCCFLTDIWHLQNWPNISVLYLSFGRFIFHWFSPLSMIITEQLLKWIYSLNISHTIKMIIALKFLKI